ARTHALDAPVARALPRPHQLLRPGRRARSAGTRARPRAPARHRVDDGRCRRPRAIQLSRRLEPRPLPGQAAARTVHRRRCARALGVRHLMTHVPVMTAEALQFLRPERGGVFVDCTVGLGGHTRALLEAGATRVIGVDRDEDALARARQTLAPWHDRVELVHSDYRSLDDVLDSRHVDRVDGALADLGVSSLQFDAPGRGFSFQRDEPLDMRMDRSTGDTAADLIARSTEPELADAIFQYGEERFSRRIARAIVESRAESPITTTGRLASIGRRGPSRRCGSG